jgi:hypothetical protein
VQVVRPGCGNKRWLPIRTTLLSEAAGDQQNVGELVNKAFKYLVGLYDLEGTILSSGWAFDTMMQAGISLALGELALVSVYVSSTILRLDTVWKSQYILNREAFETRRWSVWLVNSNDNHWHCTWSAVLLDMHRADVEVPALQLS